MIELPEDFTRIFFIMSVLTLLGYWIKTSVQRYIGRKIKTLTEAEDTEDYAVCNQMKVPLVKTKRDVTVYLQKNGDYIDITQKPGTYYGFTAQDFGGQALLISDHESGEEYRLDADRCPGDLSSLYDSDQRLPLVENYVEAVKTLNREFAQHGSARLIGNAGVQEIEIPCLPFPFSPQDLGGYQIEVSYKERVAVFFHDQVVGYCHQVFAEIPECQTYDQKYCNRLNSLERQISKVEGNLMESVQALDERFDELVSQLVGVFQGMAGDLEPPAKLNQIPSDDEEEDEEQDEDSENGSNQALTESEYEEIIRLCKRPLDSVETDRTSEYST